MKIDYGIEKIEFFNAVIPYSVRLDPRPVNNSFSLCSCATAYESLRWAASYTAGLDKHLFVMQVMPNISTGRMGKLGDKAPPNLSTRLKTATFQAGGVLEGASSLAFKEASSVDVAAGRA